ncbi:MAG: PPC domain-containing protein [Chloroflexi bacterium]|nr:PPC domain-containing protein [Chloroflexota bacterium]
MPYRLHLLGSLLLVGAITLAACGGDDAPAEEPGSETPEQSEQAVEEEPTGEEPQGTATEPTEETEPVEEDEPGEVVEEQTEPAFDPNREILVYGETFPASIEEVGGVRQFRFEGAEGDLVRIRVDGKAGMDPIVTLLEPNRTEIISNDDVSPGANRDSLVVTGLVSTGLQVIRVEAFGSDIGDFEITLELLPFDTDDDSQIVAIGTTVNGTIGQPGDVDVFEFTGTVGQPVLVYVEGVLGSDLLAQMFAPDGTFLQAADDSGHGLDPEIALTLTQDGSYRVEVFALGSKIGAYQFSVTTVPETQPEPDATVVEAMANTALAYLAALQDSDTLNLFVLAGPEAIAFRGWESAEDVERDLTKLVQTFLVGEPATPISQLDGERGRVFVPIGDGSQSVRFDMTLTGGRWLVDFWERVFVAPESDG